MENNYILMGCLVRLVLLVVLLCLCGCETEEDRAKAALSAYHSALKVSDYDGAHDMVSSEDRTAIPKEKHRAMFDGDLGKIAAEALNENEYEYQDVTLNGERAVIKFQITSPDLKTPDSQTVRMLKEGGSWKVDTDWAEDKAADELKKAVREKRAKANELWNAGRPKLAMPLFKEIASNFEDDEEFQERFEELKQEVDDSTVTGHWVISKSKDEMTDEMRVFARISQDDPPKGLLEQPASLMIRCSGKDMDIYMSVDNILSFTSGEKGRLRWGKEDAEKVRFDMGSSNKSVFFRKPQEVLSKMMKHEAETLRVEVNAVDGTEVIPFPLEGVVEVAGKVGCFDP